MKTRAAVKPPKKNGPKLAIVPPPRKPKTEPAVTFKTETVLRTSLKPHPRNYRSHPEDQLLHMQESLREHGFYKNVVVAKDGTILAGHGIVLAAEKLGYEKIPIKRLNLKADDPRALKVLAADNELPKFSENDDRVLSEILREIKAGPAGLLGTGYDDANLAALVMVTRPASEIATLDEAAEWVGMPEYDPGEEQIKLIITFKNEADRKRYVDEGKHTIDKIAGRTWSTRWPFTQREDAASVRFETKSG